MLGYGCFCMHDTHHVESAVTLAGVKSPRGPGIPSLCLCTGHGLPKGGFGTPVLRLPLRPQRSVTAALSCPRGTKKRELVTGRGKADRGWAARWHLGLPGVRHDRMPGWAFFREDGALGPALRKTGSLFPLPFAGGLPAQTSYGFRLPARGRACKKGIKSPLSRRSVPSHWAKVKPADPGGQSRLMSWSSHPGGDGAWHYISLTAISPHRLFAVLSARGRAPTLVFEFPTGDRSRRGPSASVEASQNTNSSTVRGRGGGSTRRRLEGATANGEGGS